MILRKLAEYANEVRGPVTPAFMRKPVHYLISLDAMGRCVGTRKTIGTDAPANTKPGAREYEVPVFDSPGTTLLAAPCVGIATYVFGDGYWSKNEKERRRHKKHHEAFLDCVRMAAKHDPVCERIERFYSRERPELKTLRLKSSDRLAFVANEQPDELLCQRPAIRKLWTALYSQYMSRGNGESRGCLVCGEQRPVALTHGFISGIPGKRARVKLVSFDKDAYCSHGQSQAMNAPVCQRCADAYSIALNALLKEQSTRFIDRDAEAAYVFWSKNGSSEFDANATAIHADAEAVRRLYQSPYAPAGAGGMSCADSQSFFVLSLSTTGARAIIRDWIESPVTEVRTAVCRWFDDLRIVMDRYWPAGEPRAGPGDLFGFFPLRTLERCAGRKRKGEQQYDVPITVASRLFRAALTGEIIPFGILAQVLDRLRVSHEIAPPCAALIKLVLNRAMRSRNRGESLMTPSLDSNRPDIAYVCGRLLAALERIQKRALGRVGASIIDRYFGAASTSPRVVFPRLFATAEHHLAKIRSERPYLAVILQKELEQIVDRIGDREAWLGELPSTLDLEARGRFAIGFYHQRAEDSARAAAAVGLELNGQQD